MTPQFLEKTTLYFVGFTQSRRRQLVRGAGPGVGNKSVQVLLNACEQLLGVHGEPFSLASP